MNWQHLFQPGHVPNPVTHGILVYSTIIIRSLHNMKKDTFFDSNLLIYWHFTTFASTG